MVLTQAPLSAATPNGSPFVSEQKVTPGKFSIVAVVTAIMAITGVAAVMAITAVAAVKAVTAVTGP